MGILRRVLPSVLIFPIAGWLFASQALGAAAPAAPAPSAVPKEGTLEIVGSGIEKLVLSSHVERLVVSGSLAGRGSKTDVFFRETGPRTELIRPGRKVALPAGEYWIYQVALQGGWTFETAGIPPEANHFTIRPGQTSRLAIGAPLTAKVKVERFGEALEVNFGQLVDAAGRNYTSNPRGAPPQVKIYQGDRLVGSGKFEYG